jgi:hypothetical protein
MASGPRITIGSAVNNAALTATNSTTFTYSWSTGSASAGSYTVTVTGTDLAGNAYGGSDTVTITLDDTAPTVTLSDTDADNLLAASDTVTITAFFSEAMTATPTISISGTSISGEVMVAGGNGSVITSGLLMHFPFDGSANENFNSTTVNARNPQYGQDRNGQTNKAYYFPGNNTSYISGNMPELLDDDYTYSIWINPDQPGRVLKEWIFSFGENNTAQHLGIKTDSGDGNLRFGTWGSSGFNAGNSFFDRGWIHVLVTFEKSANQHIIYIDGVNVANGTRASNFTTTNFVIGTQVAPYQSELFKGFIDDLYVWKRKLTADEISKVYSNTNQFGYTWDVDSGGVPSDGSYYASVTGTDKAGNSYVAGTQSITFTLDTTAPTVTLTSTDSDNVVNVSRGSNHYRCLL